MPDPYRLAAPLLRLVPPETAHDLALWALARGLVPPDDTPDDPILKCSCLGLDFSNPVGLAAGFDKNARAIDSMLGLGFGFVEIGSVTPRPQPGNPRPRLFRLDEDRAVINRLGFNSLGADATKANLSRRRLALGIRKGPIGVNLGKNRDSADAAADYAFGIAALAPLADYVAINVSSPNTPGLRALQGRAELDALLTRIGEALARATPRHPPPLLLKIAPDLAPKDRQDIAELALGHRLDGLIVGNTTLSRPAGLRSRHRGEAGGLSGRPLFDLATEVLADMYRLTGGKLTLIGTGGIESGMDALKKIRAGASLVQFYSAMVFEGPYLVGRIKRELAEALRAGGFASVVSAVGADHR